MKLDTLLSHAGCEVEQTTGALTPPIHLASTFERDPDLEYRRGFIYARVDNPTRQLLEKNLTGLENGEQTAVFGSGQAAAASILQSMPGGLILIPDDMYHGILTLIRTTFAEWGLQYEAVDMSSFAAIKQAVYRAKGKGVNGPLVVWLETPSNPRTKISDIAKISEFVHTHDGLVVVDSTWVTPWITRPLELGADMVVHSLTKYIGGHSDLTGGSVTAAKRVVGEGKFFTKVRHCQTFTGGGLAPFDCWLCLRGLRSLGARMRVHCSNAMAVAQFLAAHPKVSLVHYPGMPEHPGYAVASQQMKNGFGGMMSFEVAGGEQAAINCAAHLKVFHRATSLGGTESLVEHRASIEPPDTLTPRNLLRISVGLEDVGDLLADLDQALTASDSPVASKL